MGHEHKLVKLQPTTPRTAEWECSCGKTGVSTRIFDDENLAAKARASWRLHRYKERLASGASRWS